MATSGKKVYDYFDKYTFLCDMYDAHTDGIRELVMNFFPFDNSVQVIDANKGISLVKRTYVPNVRLDQLLVGNIVNVFAKLLLIRDCAPLTRRTLFRGVTRVIIEYIISAEVIGMELEAVDAVRKWRACLGATDPRDAAPGTLRYLFGQDILHNIAHGSESDENAKEMLHKFFGYENGKLLLPFRATYKDCTCCIIKPHAIVDGNVGAIVEQICTSKQFYVVSLSMFSMDIIDAKEFYEIYKDVLPEYEQMSIELTEGKFIALEIKCKDPNVNVVCEFRKLCGPRDPDVCRQLYPETIRALYGKSIVRNAVHCTDLPEDGELEVEYIFRFLAYK